MHVNGLPLPQYLIDLMAQGRWKRPTDTFRLSVLLDTHDHDFSFLEPDSMERETQGGYKILDYLGEDQALQFYGIASSQRRNAPITDRTILDLDQSILVAINWSENTVYLDYREDVQNPKVVTEVFGDKSKPTRWKQIARDIKSFAEDIGL